MRAGNARPYDMDFSADKTSKMTHQIASVLFAR